MKADYKKIEKQIMEFPTKYREGFTNNEISDLLEKMNVNERKFNKAMGVNTCLLIDNNVIYYHSDIIKGVVCAIEDRAQNFWEFD